MNTCPLTGKPCSKPKNLHITDLNADGSVSEMNVCQECGIESSPSLYDNFLFGFLEQLFAQATKKIAEAPSAMASKIVACCPQCGHTLADIANKARLGCEGCFTYFKNELVTVLMKAHGNIQHVGKIPKEWKKRQDAKVVECSIEDRVARLEEKMAVLIKEEKYEDAAAIRDAIKLIKATADSQG